MRKVLLLLVVLAAPALAQRPPPAPVLQGIDALRADFIAHSGADNVYFAMGSSQIGAPAQATLQAQALWLLQHPEVAVRIEGHGDPGDTRDHALAVGASRAEAVRDYLILLGVPAAQLRAMTWGKERPAPPSAATVLVQ